MVNTSFPKFLFSLEVLILSLAMKTIYLFSLKQGSMSLIFMKMSATYQVWIIIAWFSVIYQAKLVSHEKSSWFSSQLRLSERLLSATAIIVQNAAKGLNISVFQLIIQNIKKEAYLGSKFSRINNFTDSPNVFLSEVDFLWVHCSEEYDHYLSIWVSLLWLVLMHCHCCPLQILLAPTL